MLKISTTKKFHQKTRKITNILKKRPKNKYKTPHSRTHRPATADKKNTPQM
jgi:hypothetical protein